MKASASRASRNYADVASIGGGSVFLGHLCEADTAGLTGRRRWSYALGVPTGDVHGLGSERVDNDPNVSVLLDTMDATGRHWTMGSDAPASNVGAHGR
jgi:hypothetical protein